MRSVIGYVVLCLWLGTTAVCNLAIEGKRLRRLDLIGIIPEWRFFAPNPIEHDLVLMFRLWNGPTLVATWRQLGSTPKHRPLWNPVWNPQKRQNKGLIDLANDQSILTSEYGHPIVTAVSYLALLNTVSTAPCARGASHVQFAILQRRYAPKATAVSYDVRMLSLRHPLEPVRQEWS